MKHEMLYLEECQTSHIGCQVRRMKHNMPHFFPLIWTTTYPVQSLCNIAIEGNVYAVWKNHILPQLAYSLCVCVCVCIFERLKF